MKMEMNTAAEGTEAKTIIEEGTVGLGNPNPAHKLEVNRTIEGLTDKQVAEFTSDKTDKEIIESLDIPFKLYDNKLLIKPLKPENIKKRIEVLDEKKNKGKMPQEMMETKRITKSVQTDYREGIVLAVGDRLGDFKVSVGDKVVFHKNLIDRSWFDLFKDSLLLRTYDLECESLR